jgi:uncharacterized protein (DUF1330 family)
MAAYLIGHVRVLDAQQWAGYRAAVPATLEPWGAQLVFRGQRRAVLAGRHDAPDVVVIRFPDLQALQSWHDSAAYQALLPVRMQAAEVTLVAYEA